MGEGTVRDRNGTMMPAAQALHNAGITPVTLAKKEGFALTNGTDGMLGMLCLALHGRHFCRDECGSSIGFRNRFHRRTPASATPGRPASAANLRQMLDESPIVVADVASMAEHRVDRMLDPNHSQGLPPFLAPEAGVDSGLMIAHYTATGIDSAAQTTGRSRLYRLHALPHNAVRSRFDGTACGAQAGHRH
jgi:histidine ammonia-lyase